MELNDEYSAKLKEMSEDKLLKEIGGWKPGSEKYLRGMAELERRKTKKSVIRSNIGLYIAFGAFLLAAFIYFVNKYW